MKPALGDDKVAACASAAAESKSQNENCISEESVRGDLDNSSNLKREKRQTKCKIYEFLLIESNLSPIQKIVSLKNASTISFLRLLAIESIW